MQKADPWVGFYKIANSVRRGGTTGPPRVLPNIINTGYSFRR